MARTIAPTSVAANTSASCKSRDGMILSWYLDAGRKALTFRVVVESFYVSWTAPAVSW